METSGGIRHTNSVWSVNFPFDIVSFLQFNFVWMYLETVTTNVIYGRMNVQEETHSGIPGIANLMTTWETFTLVTESVFLVTLNA
jgi:hypothetical protein